MCSAKSVLAVAVLCSAACGRRGVPAADGSTGATSLAADTSSDTADAASFDDSGIRDDVFHGGDDMDLVPRCTVELGTFESFTSESLGALHPADVDDDGISDLVTGRGFVVRANLDVVAVADVPTSASARPGDFDGDGVIDLAHVASETGDIVVVPAVGQAGSAPIVTPTATEPIRFIARDYDEDGLDDLVLILGSANPMETWRAQGNGEFLRDRVLDPGTASSYVETLISRHGYAVELLVQKNGVQLFEYDARAGFMETDALFLGGLIAMEPIDANGDGDEQILFQSCWGSKFEGHASIGIAQERAGEWTDASYDVDNSTCSRAVAHRDVDLDGIPELFVAHGGILDAVCMQDTDLLRCGGFDIEHVVDSLAVFGEPPLLAYSTETHGGWVAELIATCE
jgi:hypothetical protein